MSEFRDFCTAALLTLASSLLAASAASQSIPRSTCLIRLAEANRLLPDEAVQTRVRQGDARATLLQQPETRVRLGPIATGENCVLHFGLGAELFPPGLAPPSVRVSAEPVGQPARVLFEESLARPSATGAVWADRTVDLAPGGSGPLHLVFETITRPGKPSAAAGWSHPHVVCEEQRSLPGKPPRPHVILISIDTLRADHLGAYGYARATSPNLDAFAAESIVFENAFATSPWTLPSHASMLTGLYPEEHRAGHGHINAGLASEVATVAELLAAAGYRTIANTAAGYVSSVHGLARGFQDWTERKGSSLRSALPGVLDALGTDPAMPTFLFLHTYDAHGPYAHPEEFNRFGANCDAEPCPAKPRSAAERERWAALAAMKLHAHLQLGRFQDIDQVIAAYDGSILFVDSQLGLLFEYLRRTGMYENALIIVTSDHGESFLERGPYISHGYTLFDEELRVPLIVRRPGASKPDRSDDLVDLTDVAALILETSGVASSTRLSGANPLARASGATPKRRFVHGGSAFTGGAYVRTRDWKVIAPVRPLGALGMQRPDEIVPGFEFVEQVFDLSSDPSEQVNRAGNGASLPAAVWILRQQLDKIESPGREKMNAHGLSKEHKDQLKALGYLD